MDIIEHPDQVQYPGQMIYVLLVEAYVYLVPFVESEDEVFLKTIILAESGILLREPVGNQVRYRANRDCPIYRELAGIFVKTEGLADVLRKALEPIDEKIELAFIFGSVAQGAEGVSSDVDLFVAGRVSFADVVKAAAQCHERLGREVNPVVMTTSDFLSRYRQGDRFVIRVLKEPKIFILGASDEFGKLIEDRPA